MTPHPQFDSSPSPLAPIDSFFYRQSILIVLVVAFLSVGALTVATGTALGLMSFRDAGYPDSATLLRVSQVVHDHHIYYPGDRPPYFISIYGPLTYVYFAAPYKLALSLGASPQTFLRLSVLLAVFICIACLYLIGKKLYGSRGVALLCALFAVSSYPMASWTVQFRPDFLALACSLAAMLWFLQSREKRVPILSAIVAGLALLFKQTFIAAPLAIVGWLLYRRRYRDAILWTAIAGLTAIAGNAIAYLHEPYMAQTIADLRHPVLEYRGALSIIWLAVRQPVVPFMVIGALFARHQRERAPERLLLLFYTVSAWAVAVLTIPQAGGNINYFFEPLMVSGALAGLGLIELQRHSTRRPLFACIAVCILLWPGLVPAFKAIRYDYDEAKRIPARKAQWQAFVAAASGRLLLSTHPDVTILGRHPEIPDGFLNDVLEKSGRWRPGDVLSEMNADMYDMIVITKGQADNPEQVKHRNLHQWDADMWAALKQHYTKNCTFDVFEVWSPKATARNTPRVDYASFGCAPVASAMPAAPPALVRQ
jgi:hypothetical protein